MARKSNKTAHVLNLLAGNDAKKEDTLEQKAPAATPESENIPSPSDASEPLVPTPAVNTPASSVSVIDSNEPDPVADLIHDKLLDELNAELKTDEPEQDAIPNTFLDEINDELKESEPVMDPASFQHPEAPLQPEPEPEPQPEPEPEPQSEPEPDFVRLNVIERIVEDKIIYFMRQFDVCTCDRCVADTITLTLNGLSPKYIVTAPYAVEPLLSFYTNKYISEITVEATKACMIVKENPRH